MKRQAEGAAWHSGPWRRHCQDSVPWAVGQAWGFLGEGPSPGQHPGVGALDRWCCPVVPVPGTLALMTRAPHELLQVACLVLAWHRQLHRGVC